MLGDVLMSASQQVACKGAAKLGFGLLGGFSSMILQKQIRDKEMSKIDLADPNGVVKATNKASVKALLAGVGVTTIATVAYEATRIAIENA